ncbi:hypothetical protein WN51_01420 [Melipona quadrifasciata]|uniref:EF-hand domain-containing protein n=1 Tax=Melipona quadrifasciata TaxID=166423 RepID=A0A0N0BEZ0_9HYME|nr:hypothetical protein WN51_01420 [Melipona quadrifasciata]
MLDKSRPYYIFIKNAVFHNVAVIYNTSGQRKNKLRPMKLKISQRNTFSYLKERNNLQDVTGGNISHFAENALTDLLTVCRELNLENSVEELMRELGADEHGRISYQEFLRCRLALRPEIEALRSGKHRTSPHHTHTPEYLPTSSDNSLETVSSRDQFSSVQSRIEISRTPMGSRANFKSANNSQKINIYFVLNLLLTSSDLDFIAASFKRKDDEPLHCSNFYPVIYRRIQKDDELFYTAWSLVMVREPVTSARG